MCQALIFLLYACEVHTLNGLLGFSDFTYERHILIHHRTHKSSPSITKGVPKFSPPCRSKQKTAVFLFQIQGNWNFGLSSERDTLAQWQSSDYIKHSRVVFKVILRSLLQVVPPSNYQNLCRCMHVVVASSFLTFSPVGELFANIQLLLFCMLCTLVFSFPS